MKDMFDKKHHRLSDSEKATIWRQITLSRGSRRFGRRTWLAPALGTVAVAVCGLVFLYVINPLSLGGSGLGDKTLSSAHGRGQAPPRHLADKPAPRQVAKGPDQVEDKESTAERAGKSAVLVAVEPKKVAETTAAAQDVLEERPAVTSSKESSQQTAAVTPPADAAQNATLLPDTDERTSYAAGEPDRGEDAAETVGPSGGEYLRGGRAGEVELQLKEEGTESYGLSVEDLARSRIPATPVTNEELGTLAVAAEHAGASGKLSPLALAMAPQTAVRRTAAKRTSGADPFITTEQESLSTFSLRTGNTSYIIARGYLDARRLPRSEEVHGQEFVNFFGQGYALDVEGDFAIHADGVPSPFRPGCTLLRIGLRSRVPPAGEVAGHPAARVTQQILARDAAIQVKFYADQVLRYRLVGTEDRDVNEDGSGDGPGEACVLATGHQVTALYEIELAPATERQLAEKSKTEADITAPAPLLASVRLWYEKPADEATDQTLVQLQHDVTGDVIAASFREADPHLQLDAVVAEFAEILRSGSEAEGIRLAALVPIAARLAALMSDDSAVEELRRLLETAADLLPGE